MVFCIPTFLLAAGSYLRPPQEVLDVINANRTPSVSVSPTHTHLLLETVVANPTIADIAKPMLRLAGFRIDPATNGRHLTTYITALSVKPLIGGSEMKIALPADAKVATPVWSADGKMIAFTNATATSTELWVIDVATGKARKLPVVVNGATESAAAVASAPFDWMPDQHTLLVKAVPAGRGNPPAEPSEPPGPAIQESSGKAAPVRTNQDMLRKPYDEDLFSYYATSQLTYVDAISGKVTPTGKSSIVLNVAPSPDGRYVLVTRLHKPFSYLYGANSFPRSIEVLDRNGVTVYTVANLTTYSEASTRVTRSLITRGKPYQTPGFPTTTYIENVGVYPDVMADYMTTDNLLNRGKTFVAAFSTAITNLIAKGKP